MSVSVRLQILGYEHGNWVVGFGASFWAGDFGKERGTGCGVVYRYCNVMLTLTGHGYFILGRVTGLGFGRRVLREEGSVLGREGE